MYSKKEQRLLFELSKELLQKKQLLFDDEPTVKVEKLRKVIVYHEWRYYVKNDPVISDFEYDQLYKQLEAIENENPELIKPDSPTQRISSDLTTDFPSVNHIEPMLSLANSYNEEDLIEFDAQIKRFLMIDENEDIEYCLEPKYDGGTIVLIYENDKLVRAATRGNGVAGDEMTHNARVIKAIPLKANFSKFGIKKVELRGEVVIRKDIFEKINKEREKAGESLFANPRNTATGGLRMKDPTETAKRNLTAFMFQFGYADGNKGTGIFNYFKTHDETIDTLGNIGFKVPVAERKVCKNIKEAIDFCLYWQEKREDYSYEIDGMVIKVNNLEYQKRAGSTSHHPRWAIAFKFKAKQATTKLERVEFQVGKTGSVTPVAKVQPVHLAGVTVSSISLHNEDFIKDKDLHIGDTVLVERAGDVIPYIVKAMKELRTGTEKAIEFPKECPVCHTKLAKPEHEAVWRCVNYDCRAQVLQRLIHHVSKSGMDIDGFGKAYVEKFYELGWLKSLVDVYRLDYEKIAQLEGFGQKSANNLAEAIKNAKKNPISRFLQSLSIHHLGPKVSKLVAAEINHVLDLSKKTVDELTDVKDIGPTVAENIVAFFHNAENMELMKEMEALGVNLTQTDEDKHKIISADAPFSGKTILFTGKLLKLSRKEAQEKAETAGARNISAISSKLNYLVVGEKPGSKLKKAQALGTVTILTEDEFLKMV